MRLDRHSGLRGRFFREGGEQVRWVIWYDTETHEWEAWRHDPDQARLEGVADAIIATWRYRGRCLLRFEPAPFHAPPTPRPSPPPREPPPATPRRGGVFIPPGTGLEECEVKGCHRRAEWYTHDSEEVDPVMGGDGKLYRRAAVTRRHYFCDRCYRQPVTQNLRGVEREVNVTMGRPDV